MNPHKILFVTCVNNETLYTKCCQHLNNIDVPFGITMETLPIRGASSMTEGYNQALQNDAKYKVYLHQDTFITNEYIISDVIKLFESNSNLGLLGVLGCKTLPLSGIWWEGTSAFGKIGNVCFKDVKASYELVEAVDGILMATQYDIRWRDDLFKGFHFYDTSQSCEFIKHDYLVGIPKQSKSWCNHIGNNLMKVVNSENYQRDRQIFIDRYKIVGKLS